MVPPKRVLPATQGQGQPGSLADPGMRFARVLPDETIREPLYKSCAAAFSIAAHTKANSLHWES